MKGRDFISFFGSVTAARPNVARAQQTRRVGVLLNLREQDSESKAYIGAFLKHLEELGWKADTNLQLDCRWTGDDASHAQKHAAELVALAPEVILAADASHVGALQQITHTIPIVFVQVVDPIGAGIVKSLAHPGSNATGLTNLSELEISGKLLELLKQIAPDTKRAAVLRDPNVAWAPNWPIPLVLARSLGVVVSPLDPGFDLGSGYASHIEDSITEFAENPNGALIVLPTSFAIAHRGLIISLANRFRLPAIYPSRYFVTDGGLISYGPDAVDQYQFAAGYVDYILKGKKFSHLPVHPSTKVALVINLKTARSLDLTVPPTLLASADEVIE
jgi:putative tryptophan/tyrosine transport system substrate-binding protein